MLLGINDAENKNQEMNQWKISCGYVAKRVLFDGRERKVSVAAIDGAILGFVREEWCEVNSDVLFVRVCLRQLQNVNKRQTKTKMCGNSWKG